MFSGFLLLNSFKHFGLKRKLGILCHFEGIFELHSWATERKNDKERVKKANF